MTVTLYSTHRLLPLVAHNRENHWVYGLFEAAFRRAFKRFTSLTPGAVKNNPE